MKSSESGVLRKWDLYFSTPSPTAKRLYFYPISAGHFFYSKNYHLVRENYDSFLVLYVIDGTFTFVKDGKHITAREGDTVFLDCRVPHEYYTKDHLESIWVHFAGSNSEQLYTEITKVSGCLLKCSDREHVRRLLFRLFSGISGENPVSEMQLSLDVYKLLAELSSPSTVRGKNKESYEDSVQEVREYISAHLQQNLTVQELADCMHMSPSHFSRVFKQQTGFSPYDYVLIVRLNRAKELLQRTSMTVSEIAYETGFNSESNFIYFFTTNVGISPGKFRRLKF
ncbi:MAG TPA: helix-turn-helix transcriptional regulator [Candidatus Fimenecus stercoravium]|nr:helix-turn-helix transcriptional regulator [Candidatus Fimenecus stercoravium]